VSAVNAAFWPTASLYLTGITPTRRKLAATAEPFSALLAIATASLMSETIAALPPAPAVARLV